MTPPRKVLVILTEFNNGPRQGPKLRNREVSDKILVRIRLGNCPLQPIRISESELLGPESGNAFKARRLRNGNGNGRVKRPYSRLCLTFTKCGLLTRTIRVLPVTVLGLETGPNQGRTRSFQIQFEKITCIAGLGYAARSDPTGIPADSADRLEGYLCRETPRR